MNNLLIRPIITEKSLREATKGKYTFAVEKSANKAYISQVIAKVFNVKPITVKTIIVKGEMKRKGKLRLLLKESSWKKAVVQLAAGQKINLFDVGETNAK